MAARVLVVFATKMGSTQQVAEAIAAVLRDRGLEAEARSVRDVKSLAGWDAVVIGSALYAAHWQRDVNRFVARLRQELATRRVWAFSSGPLDHAHAAADLPINPTAAELLAGIPLEGHRTFGGRLDPNDPAVDEQILRTHAVGDFRDWNVIRAWAGGVATALGA